MLVNANANSEPPWAAHAAGHDGYDIIEFARDHGWLAVPSWGRDGYDLGNWPLVVIYVRNIKGNATLKATHSNNWFDLAYYVEGDVRTERFATLKEREIRIDELAFWHWRHEDQSWVENIERAQDLPAELRGPFSRERLETEATPA